MTDSLRTKAPPKERAPPKLTLEQAREALDKAISKFDNATNRAMLDEGVRVAQKVEDPMQRRVKMITTVVPIVQAMLNEEMKAYGFDESTLMMGLLQIQMYATEDAAMQPKVMKIMHFLEGKFDAACPPEPVLRPFKVAAPF